MFTNQKFLGMLLILFIFGTGVYLTVSKFKQDVSNATASPSPSATPEALNFFKAPAPTSAGGTDAKNDTPLVLLRNKKLSQFPGILKPEILQNKKAIIQTAKGRIELEIYPEASAAASNFILLSANGFYDGLTFHRVEP